MHRILLQLGFYFPDCGISGKVLLQTARAAENGPQICDKQDGE
jgi:hypothetical protein